MREDEGDDKFERGQWWTASWRDRERETECMCVCEKERECGLAHAKPSSPYLCGCLCDTVSVGTL